LKKDNAATKYYSQGFSHKKSISDVQNNYPLKCLAMKMTDKISEACYN